MTECIKEGPHTSEVGYFNPENGAGKMCRRHYNQWRKEQGKKVGNKHRDYTHPDKRTWEWKEAQAHKAAEHRNKLVNGERLKELEG